MTPSGTPPNPIPKPHSPPCSPSSSSPCSPFKGSRPLFELTQSLPDDLKLQIFDTLSNSSSKDLKTLTRLSQDSYDRYAPILYKRLHITSYDAPIKMKLMNPKYRKGYHPFTEEDEKAYKRYKERRMGIMGYCESLRFVNEDDIRATLGLVREFSSHRKIPGSDECSNRSKTFGNERYLIFQDECSIINPKIGYKDNNKVYSSMLLWKTLNPTHICIGDPIPNPYQMISNFSNLDDCGYLRSNENHWTNISSVTFHDIVHGRVQFNEKVDQRLFFNSDYQVRRQPRSRIVVLNEDDLTMIGVRSRTPDHNATKNIEILNCPNDNDRNDVVLDRQLMGLSPFDGIIHLLSGEEGEVCVCCGRR